MLDADGIARYGTEGTTRRNRFPETTNVVTNIHTERALLSSIQHYTTLEPASGCEKISPVRLLSMLI